VLCSQGSQGPACGRSHPTRGLATLVHRNRRLVFAEQDLEKGGTDFGLPARLLDQGEYGVDGGGLDIDEPPHFLDNSEKRIDLKRPTPSQGPEALTCDGQRPLPRR
jgi:hypothetical protein